MDPAQPQPQPQARPKPVYNKARFEAYKQSATAFVNGRLYDANELGHMLHDIRHDEVPKAFAVALYHATKEGEVRHNLAGEFRGLVEMAVLLGFGSTERGLVQPWFLQNWDTFVVSCADGLLNLNSNDQRVQRKPDHLRRSVRGLLALVSGVRNYMSLDRLAPSTGVHALLVAAGHTKSCFLKNGFRQMGGDARKGDDPQYFRPLTLAHVLFMDEVARAVLAEPSRSVDSWERAFGHYAGAAKWRAFAARCRSYCRVPGVTAPALLMLERQVEHAVSQSAADASLEEAAAEEQHRAAARAHARARRLVRPGARVREALLDLAAAAAGGVEHFWAATPTRRRRRAAARDNNSSSSSSSEWASIPARRTRRWRRSRWTWPRRWSAWPPRARRPRFRAPRGASASASANSSPSARFRAARAVVVYVCQE